MNDSVKKIVLEDPGPSKSRPLPGWLGGASWLVAPLMIAALLGTLVLLRRAPSQVFTILLVIVCGLPVLWGLVSIFYPASPDRRCPQCRELSLEPIRQGELIGLRCTKCGHLDHHASAWMFAEEGNRPLEPLVIENRKSTHTHTDPGGLS